MKKIRVVIGIDVETDVGSWTPFYRGTEEGIPVLLDIFSREDVKVTFFFTGESVEKFPEKAGEILKAGHEVGCHSLYHETVGDELFPIPGIKPLLQEEVPLRMRKATEIIEKYTGIKPVTFRAPRLWGSTVMVNALENLGYKADATYPLFYHRKTLFPYHPDRNNWLEKGESNLLEIPVFADITKKSEDPYGRDLDQWPVFRTQGSGKLMQMVKNFVNYLSTISNNIPVLCFYFHPWEFISLPESFHYGEGTVVPDPFIIKNCGQKAAEELRKFLISLKEKYETTFFSAKALAEIYEK